jgi:hypothetical protein
MQGRRFIEGQDPEGLKSARTLDGLDHDAGSLVRGLVSVPAEAGHMEQDVREAIVRHDEAEPLGHVEPLDVSADLNELERILLGDRTRLLPSTGVEGGLLPTEIE